MQVNDAASESRRAPGVGYLAFFLVTGAALVALFPGLLTGEVFFERDVHQMLYGQYVAFTRSVAAGSWPVWDPWMGLGQPMLANPAAQVLYPPTWLCLVLSPEATYSVYVILHLLVGAVAVRRLAGRLGVSPPSAAAAGLFWMLSGPILSLVNLWHHLAGACLMPVVVAAIDAVLEKPLAVRVARLAGAAGLQVLAGSFDMCVLTAGLAVAWTVFRIPAIPAGSAEGWRRRLGALLLAAFVAAGLSAGLLLPLLELWRATARADLSPDVRTFWSLSPLLLPQIFLPVLPQFLPLVPAVRAAFFENREPLVASIYLGLGTVPLVVAGLRSRPRRVVLLLLVVFAGAALVALGRYGLLYPAATSVLPPLRSLRYPSKATVLLALAWSLLAALGLDRWREESRRRLPWIAGGLALAGALLITVLIRWDGGLVDRFLAVGPGRDTAVAGATRALVVSVILGAAGLAGAARGGWSRAPGGALAALAALDLLVFHRPLNPTAPAASFRERPAIVAGLPPAVRVQSWDYMVRILGKRYRRREPALPGRDAPPAVPARLATALARQAMLSPPVGARYGFFGGIDRDWLGLQPEGVHHLHLALQIAEETPAHAKILRLAGVSHTVSLHREGLEELVPLATVNDPFAGPVHLHGVPDALPRVYCVGGGRVVAGGRAALETLLSDGFDPGKEVLLAAGDAREASSTFAADVRLLDDRPDTVRVLATLESPGFLVVADAWAPGWEARVNGRSVPLLRANLGLRAVALLAGESEVTMTHRPPGAPAGGLLSLLTASGLAAFAVREARRRAPVPSDGGGA